ncbi:dodecin domain-containing protein [Methylobacterium crusticola]|uniref:dodecin domain-containing protein n=1 Tax=Methylobacterium crusticola TaxID=1697972 RepID=UPI00193A2154
MRAPTSSRVRQTRRHGSGFQVVETRGHVEAGRFAYVQVHPKVRFRPDGRWSVSQRSDRCSSHAMPSHHQCSVRPQRGRTLHW